MILADIFHNFLEVKVYVFDFLLRKIFGKNGIKISLRALDPYTVDQIAARFGGGGHRLAAGLTLNLPLDEAVETIEKALCEALA